MNRKLARKNLITGLVAASLSLIILGATFLAANLYLN
jgi:hypothetical protein